MKINLEKLKKQAGKTLNEVASATKVAGKNIADTSIEMSKKASEKVDKTKKQAMKSMDKNGDGQVTIEDVIIMALKFPGIKINRAEFIKKEFSKYCSEDVINNIIASTPLKAGVSKDVVDKIATDVIQYERICVSEISTALSIPGGVAMIATLPTDIAQYYGYMLRATQKLLHLYGFQEIDVNDGQLLDSATMNTLIICMGVMYGVVQVLIQH